MTKLNSMDIQVQRMYRFDTDRPLKAFVDIIVNDSLLIKGLRVMEGKKGIFVSMPREQAKDSKWYDMVRCLTQEVRDDITTVVLNAYSEDRPQTVIDHNKRIAEGWQETPTGEV